MAKRPGGAMLQSAAPTNSQLIPVLTKWTEIGKKSELAPMIVTVVTVLLLFMTMDGDLIVYKFQYGTFFTSWYLMILCAYLMMLSVYFIRRLAGKDKSWIVLGAVGVFTAYMLFLFNTEHAFLWMYQLFHHDLAGGDPDATKDAFTELFVKHFLGTGFFEETFKAMPLFAIAIASAYMPDALRSKFGIEEPLDGILLGAASGGGFAFTETIGQYITGHLLDTWKAAAVSLVAKLGSMHIKLSDKQVGDLIGQAEDMVGWHPGVTLLIPRSLSEAFGHMAYAGCFGYFIGLAVLKKEQRWKILAIGLVSSSLLHAMWDSVSSLNSELLLFLVGLASYAVLAAAILKAREISPNRAKLMPSIFVGSLNPTASVVAAYAGGPAAAVVPAGAGFMGVAAAAPVAVHATPKVVPGPNPLPTGTASLRIGAKYLVIVPGLRLMAHQVPGLQTQSPEGLVAEVTRNPNDPGVLGLTNLSTTAWEVVTSSNTRREIQPGQTVKLSPGTKIDFGETDGEVR
jgi:RsiW-degrading membrane proteinase PrsW (M82 family)